MAALGESSSSTSEPGYMYASPTQVFADAFAPSVDSNPDRYIKPTLGRIKGDWLLEDALTAIFNKIMNGTERPMTLDQYTSMFRGSRELGHERFGAIAGSPSLSATVTVHQWRTFFTQYLPPPPDALRPADMEAFVDGVLALIYTSPE